MAKYYYKKYNSVSKLEYSYTLGSSRTFYDDYNKGWSSFSFNKDTGKFSVAGTLSTSVPHYSSLNGRYTFVKINSSWSYMKAQDREDYGWDYRASGQEFIVTSSTVYSIGSYVGEVVAEDGMYPSNGRYTDGFWYVKDRLAFPELKIKINGSLKTAENGWINTGGGVS